jgi:hypothetical protein
MASMPHAAVQVYELEYHDENQGFFFALSEAWNYGPWSSDARVLYCRIEQEKLTHLVVIGGTHVAWQGKLLMTADASFTFFEWRKQDAITNAGLSRVSLTPLFEQLTGGSAPVDVSPISTTYAEKQ